MAGGNDIHWWKAAWPHTLRITLRYAVILVGIAFLLRFCAAYLVIHPGATYPVFAVVVVFCIALGVLISARSKRLGGNGTGAAISPQALLSTREMEVLEALLTEQNNRGICEALFIEMSTLKTHINHIYKKLGVKHRRELRQRYAAFSKNRS